MQLSEQQIKDFQEAVWSYSRQAKRIMPWRDNPTPYFVLVSELMLQQTQVSRVVPKFEQFVSTLPTITDVAKAPLGEALRLWNGLGYNRRAKFLHQAAQKIVQDYAGVVPSDERALVLLPGVGRNTAGAIRAYAFNQPAVFVETNIRTVYFYHFFAMQATIDDKQVNSLVAQTLEDDHPREWYWALMDYGTYLKKTQPSNINQSRHYMRQSKFEGSRRQLRGSVLRLLLEAPQSKQALSVTIKDARLPGVLQELIREGFVQQAGGLLKLADLP